MFIALGLLLWMITGKAFWFWVGLIVFVLLED